ncbi:MAG: mechanosensitive ion channel family protein [Streptosporangiales bacterium]|nr:mechanosensitive ion channel family protein [Streptosporangiales bacterium]
MAIANAPMAGLAFWARNNLLESILLVLGALLLTRLADWIRGVWVARIDAQAAGADGLVASEAAKHRHVMAQVITWTTLAIIYVVTAVLVITTLGVPVAGLVAPAALLSAALGFGLQRFVQDIGAGLFLTGEKQYGYGDLVKMDVNGVSDPSTGTVEEVTLRVTRLRSDSGEVIIIPNGQITQVTNLSRNWSRAVIDVPVPNRVDVGHASEVLQKAGEDVYNDERMRRMMLDAPAVIGVERMEVHQFSMRMVARTLPGMQFLVGRELRARIAQGFWAEGVIVSAEIDTDESSEAPS